MSEKNNVRRIRRKILSTFFVLFSVALSIACYHQPVFGAAEKKTISKKKAVFDLSQLPEYDGSPYCEVNDNITFFKERQFKKAEKSYETYKKLDDLGRCVKAVASVGKDLMPTEERGQIGMVKPTGWQWDKYEFVDGRYLYNRCHLIGYQLTGENANLKNLITGTRYMNVEGMLPFENQIADYVHKTGNHVLYRVIPIFEGDNMLASGVEMEAASVEDRGETLQFHVYCYNVQPGVIIDYTDGDSEPDPEADLSILSVTEAENNTELISRNASNQKSGSDTSQYAVNSNNGKIHINGACSATRGGAQSMKRPVYFDTYEEAEVYSKQIAPGQKRRQCGNCY